MSKVLVHPAHLFGSVTVPPSKSQSHRSIICSALSKELCVVKNINLCEDVMATIEGLRRFGKSIEIKGSTAFISGTMCSTSAVIDCCESGSTLRFLLPVAAALGINTTFTGELSLKSRPIKPLLAALSENGAIIKSTRLPITVGGRIKSGDFYITGDISSQFVSGLLMALSLLSGESRIELTSPLLSNDYVNMTVRALEKRGITVCQSGCSFVVHSAFAGAADETIEGDWSHAAFFLAARHLGADIEICGLNNDSYQGDKIFLKALQNQESFDAENYPDLVPALAVVMAFGKKKSIIRNCGRLRFKESNRLRKTAENLNRMGASATICGNDLLINGGTLHKAEFDGANDHRIVMAFAIAACFLEGDSTITDIESVTKSYPNFWSDLKALGGKIDVI